MHTTKLFFLGPVQYFLGDAPVKLKSVKATALLAYLAVNSTPQSRDHLTDLLWPDSLPDAARKNLRNTLWSIRKAFGDDLLDADGDRISLTGNVWLDVRAFETALSSPGGQVNTPPAGDTLQAATDLYRAPLLDGFALFDAPDFELWLSTEQGRFGQLYLRALETQVAAQRRQGNWAAVIATARKALAADNLQEPMYRAIMEAHAHLDERAEALRQYDTLRSTLTNELGVNPLPETEKLHTAILEGTLTQTRRSRTPTSPFPTQPAPHRPGIPFVGRQAELTALDEALQSADSGQVRVALISGELGIGKSRLWQQWATGLPGNLTMLETRCLDTTQLLPFAPLTGLFSGAGCVEQLLSPDNAISPIWLTELARLMPEIRQHLPTLPQPPALPQEEEHRRLFEAFTQVVRIINSRPVIIFVDDLHWVDQSTLDWLVYLVDRMHSEPLLLVCTYRPGDAPGHLSHVLAGWGRKGIVHRLPLPRFTLQETSALLAALDGSTNNAEQLQTKSAGNPYFLIELNRAQATGTPPELVDLIKARLDRLPDTAKQVLQAAAVLDAGFDFATLRRTSGRGEEETLNAIDILLEADILVENSSGYAFAHPLVASVVHNTLSLARHSFLHRRAAEALEATFANRLETVAGQLAHHYAQAGRPEQAADYAEMAAKHALKLTALPEAVKFYRQALRLVPTATRHLGLGEALGVQGNLEESRVELGAAAQEFAAANDCLGGCRADLAMAMSYMPSGQGARVVEWAEKALLKLDTQPDVELLASAHHLMAAGGLMAGHSPADVEAHLVEAGRLCLENDMAELAGISQFELGNLLAQRGNLAGALAAFEQALQLAEKTGTVYQILLAHNNLAYHAMLADQLDMAHRHIEAGLELAEHHLLFMPRQYLYSTRGEIALADGELDEAERWLKDALAEAERNDNRLHVANVTVNLGLVAQKRGDFDEALLLMEEARQTIVDLNAVYPQAQTDLRLAGLYLQRGERVAAEQALQRAEAHLSGAEREGLNAWALRVRSEMGAKT